MFGIVNNEDNIAFLYLNSEIRGNGLIGFETAEDATKFMEDYGITDGIVVENTDKDIDFVYTEEEAREILANEYKIE